MKRGKKYVDAAKKIEREKLYAPLDAIRLVKKNASAKFEETVEVSVKLGVDPRQADQQVRGTVILPHGTGRKVQVAVFAQGEKVREAEEAGADVVGAADLAERIKSGWQDFDVLVATPDIMSVVGKLGKILGPRMPNPKSGTVTFDVGKVVKEIRAGRAEYRVDKYGIVHLPIGKSTFSEQALVENYGTLLGEIMRAKPSGAKGRYIRSVVLSSTMSPGVKVDPTRITGLLEEVL